MADTDRELLELSCRDMLFAHWPIEPDALRAWIPRTLSIDTYDGNAWIGIAAFRVQSVRVGANDTSVPVVTPFLNLNLRTYVRNDGGPGVYFLSSDIENRIAATIGHRLFGFAVYQARMKHRNRNDEMTFRSERVGSGSRRKGFQVRYEPAGEVFQAEPDTIENALIEQSRYYIAGEPARSPAETTPVIDNRPVRTGEITQPVHRLQPVDAEIQVNTLIDDFEEGLLNEGPIVHYCERWDAGWNPLQSISGD